jgi:hypothetical protein
MLVGSGAELGQGDEEREWQGQQGHTPVPCCMVLRTGDARAARYRLGHDRHRGRIWPPASPGWEKTCLGSETYGWTVGLQAQAYGFPSFTRTRSAQQQATTRRAGDTAAKLRLEKSRIGGRTFSGIHCERR